MAVQPRYTRQMASVAKQAKADGLGQPKRVSVLEESRKALLDPDGAGMRQIIRTAPDRIEAARLMAERLAEWIRPKQPNWHTFTDSLGSVISVKS